MLEALDRTANSQRIDKPTKDKPVAEECRTISPNTCQAGLRRIGLDEGDAMERSDLSVIYRIRLSAGSLFNRQEIRKCQQI